MWLYKILSFELSQYDDKLKRIKETYRNGIDTLEEYKESKEALEKEQTLLNQKMESLKNHLKGEKQENIYHQIKSVYDLLTDKSIPIDVKYKASHFLINKITFYKQKNTIEIEYK